VFKFIHNYLELMRTE